MEGLAHLVTESLVRHGFEPAFDYRRLQWSKWFPCQDSFSLVLAPCKPGLFALAEEVIAPGELVPFCGASEPRSRHPERSEGSRGDGKRMLALFEISEADDLGMSLGRLFLSGSSARARFASGRCFARYVAVEDANQRRSALTALQRWMADSAGAASGVTPEAGFVSGHDFSRAANFTGSVSALAAACDEPADASAEPESSNKQAQIGPPTPIPSGF